MCVDASGCFLAFLPFVLHSAVGLTDKSGKLVGSISVADLRDLPADKFGLLLQPVSKVRVVRPWSGVLAVHWADILVCAALP